MKQSFTKTVNNGTEYHAHFDSVESFFNIEAYVKNNKPLEGSKKSNLIDAQENWGDASSWVGRLNTADLQLAVHSNKVTSMFIDDVKELNNAIPDSFNQADFEANDIFHDETGFYCDTVSYFMGEENCMINYAPTQVQKPVIWLAAPFNGISGVSGAQFHNRGVAFTSAVKTLTERGYNVGVLGFAVSTVSTNDFCKATITVVIKQPDADLNLAHMQYLLAHQSAFRTAVLGYRAYISGEACGSSCNISAARLEDIKANNEFIINVKGDRSLAEFNCTKTGYLTVTNYINGQLDGLAA